eukprot:319454-Alexandrium_andersonii.AAC.1
MGLGGLCARVASSARPPLAAGPRVRSSIGARAPPADLRVEFTAHKRLREHAHTQKRTHAPAR